MLKKSASTFILLALPLALTLAGCASDEEDAGPDAVFTSDRPQATAEPTEPAAAAAPQPPSTLPIPRPRDLQYDTPPPLTIDPDKSYTATFKLAKGAEFDIELFAKDAPNTVKSFVFLAREGFYDGVTFHRVIANFMAQGGDPTGTGTGGPVYRFESELTPERRHDGPGVLSMANSGGINTNGSQSFITFGATPSLDGYEPDGTKKACEQRGVSCHTVFGKVSKGLDVAMALTVRDPSTATTPGDAIATVVITEN